jgi:hypothetical protein
MREVFWRVAILLLGLSALVALKMGWWSLSRAVGRDRFLVFILAVFVFAFAAHTLWRFRAPLLDCLISTLALAILIRRRVVAAFAELRRRVIERAGNA